MRLRWEEDERSKIDGRTLPATPWSLERARRRKTRDAVKRRMGNLNVDVPDGDGAMRGLVVPGRVRVRERRAGGRNGVDGQKEGV
jgi:hypothetical protein